LADVVGFPIGEQLAVALVFEVDVELAVSPVSGLAVELVEVRQNRPERGCQHDPLPFLCAAYRCDG